MLDSWSLFLFILVYYLVTWLLLLRTKTSTLCKVYSTLRLVLWLSLISNQKLGIGDAELLLPTFYTHIKKINYVPVTRLSPLWWMKVSEELPSFFRVQKGRWRKHVLFFLPVFFFSARWCRENIFNLCITTLYLFYW